ncbi:MAG: hypothetical protein OXR68_08195 [Alphaproteobacteria bacterium]|nr:hypothetical protein [Alphaproteobacteria bacterium]MDD9920586.1 hypothetical protein [Alphaproteobacteria bacterium]
MMDVNDIPHIIDIEHGTDLIFDLTIGILPNVKAKESWPEQQQIPENCRWMNRFETGKIILLPIDGDVGFKFNCVYGNLWHFTYHALRLENFKFCTEHMENNEAFTKKSYGFNLYKNGSKHSSFRDIGGMIWEVLPYATAIHLKDAQGLQNMEILLR